MVYDIMVTFGNAENVGLMVRLQAAKPKECVTDLELCIAKDFNRAVRKADVLRTPFAEGEFFKSLKRRTGNMSNGEKMLAIAAIAVPVAVFACSAANAPHTHVVTAGMPEALTRESARFHALFYSRGPSIIEKGTAIGGGY